MRSSPTSNSRNSLHFQRNNRVLPVFSYKAVLAAVHSFNPTEFPVQISAAFVSQIDRSKPALRFIAREADFETASLATMFNGVVLSQDSDYFVLCAQDRTCGYAPLSDLSFAIKQAQEATGSEADDGFQAAPSSKKRRNGPSVQQPTTQSTSPFPPVDLSSVEAIKITVYSGSALAQQLGIPPNLLTLLAALMGNDHVNFSALFFRNSRASLDSSTRLYHLARIIKDCWTRFSLQAKAKSAKLSAAASSGTATPATSGTATPLAPTTPGRPGQRPTTKAPSLSTEVLMHELLDPAKSLVHRIVEKLLEDSQVDWLSSSEVSDMTDQLLAAMSAYTTSAQENLLSGQERELARFLKGHFEGLIEQQQQQHQERQPLAPERIETLDTYRSAYMSGHLPPAMLGVMLYRRLLSFTLLEDGQCWDRPFSLSAQRAADERLRVEVSQASVSHTYGAPLRVWLYAVLFSAFGLEWAQTPEDDARDLARKEELERQKAEREAYLDEVVSLHSGSTGSHGGYDSEVEDEEGRDDESDEEEDNLPPRKADPVVVEMLRKGDRATEVTVPIPSLASLAREVDPELAHSSGCSLTSDQRTLVFLSAHQAYTSALAAVPAALQVTTAVLRHIVKTTAERSSSRTLWWKHYEVRGALLMALLLTREQPEDVAGLARKAPQMPTNQSIHSAAVFQGALDASIMLRQALLLDEVQPHALFHGGVWHALVPSAEHHEVATSVLSAGEQELVDKLVGLVAGEEGYVYSGPSREERKARKKQEKEAQRPQAGEPVTKVSASFNLLDVS